MQNAEAFKTGGGWRRHVPVGLCGALALAGLTGCARSVAIYQDKYINTASQLDRPVDKRTGEPLEVAIVCVLPKDLNKPGNELLRPDSKVTCKDWYERRPQGGTASAKAFDLPNRQIYLLTNDKNAFGQPKRYALRGTGLGEPNPLVIGGIDFPFGQLHDGKSVIYVFCKFTGPDGGVLPVMPAKFNPPGAYTEKLAVKIGVDANEPGGVQGQYTKVDASAPRKMHKHGN